MPRIRLILEDDHGQQIEQTFALTGDLDSLDGIDEAQELAFPPCEAVADVYAQEVFHPAVAALQ